MPYQHQFIIKIKYITWISQKFDGDLRLLNLKDKLCKLVWTRINAEFIQEQLSAILENRRIFNV